MVEAMLKLGKPSARKSQRVVIRKQVGQKETTQKKQQSTSSTKKSTISNQTKRKIPSQNTTTIIMKDQQQTDQRTPKKRNRISVKIPKTYTETTPVPIPYYTIHPMEELWLSLPRKK